MTQQFTIDGVTITKEKLQEFLAKNPELKKELVEKKSGSWRAEKGCSYYYVYNSGFIYPASEEHFDLDDYRYLTGNYFRTDKKTKIFCEVSDGSTYVEFMKVDGMYSVCYTEKGNLVHLSAVTPLKEVDGGYTIEEEYNE